MQKRAYALGLLLALPILGAAYAAGPRWVGHTAGSGLRGWSQVERSSPRDIRATRVAGRAATEFSVHPGDSPVPSGERTELVASSADVGARAGSVRTYRWAVFFPRDLTPVPDSTWNIFTQFHESAPDECHPNLALQINTRARPVRLRLQVRGAMLGAGCEPSASRSWDFAPLVFDRWEDFQLRVGWTPDSQGFVQLRLNGKTVVPLTHLPTLYQGQSAYLKQGFYRGLQSTTSHIFQSAFRVY